MRWKTTKLLYIQIYEVLLYTDKKKRCYYIFRFMRWAHVGVMDSNEAEFIASLELSFDKEWLKRGNLIIESDSKVALAWVSSSCPWKLRFYGNKLRNLQRVMGNVTFVHKTRESNELADSLAKEGAIPGRLLGDVVVARMWKWDMVRSKHTIATLIFSLFCISVSKADLTF